MKMKELRELLDGYSGDGGVNVQDWGTRFEIVITEEV